MNFNPPTSTRAPKNQHLFNEMVLGLHGNEVLFSLIAPFLFSDDLPLVAAINQLTWQQQLSRTEHIKKKRL